MDKKTIPTFAIFKDNKKIATLIHCFVKETRVCKDDYLALKGWTVAGTRYQIQWDDSVFPDICELKNKEYMNAVISFQKHSYGCFAIVKKARDATEKAKNGH